MSSSHKDIDTRIDDCVRIHRELERTGASTNMNPTHLQEIRVAMRIYVRDGIPSTLIFHPLQYGGKVDEKG